MMHTQIKMSVMFVLFLIMTLLPLTSVLAVQSDERDEQIQQRIAAQVAKSSLLQGIQIEIHVQQRLVVLT